MAVGANSYGTVARVEALVGDLVASRTFATGTIPSLTEVEAIIDDTAAELNMQLEQSGYTVPVDNSNDPQAHAFLVAANSYGAAAVVLSTLPAEAYVEPGEESPAQGRRQFYQSKFRSALKIIKEQELPADRDVGLASRLYAGSMENRNTGATKLPIFTRAMTDYPGGRTLERF